MQSENRIRAALGAIVLAFGGSMPAYKLAGESFGPATSNLIRFVLASVMLVFAARRHTKPERRQWRRLFVTGAFGLGLMAMCLSVGVDRGSAIIASVIVALEPIGVALAGVLLVGDRPTRRSLLALAVGFFGAVVAAGLFSESTGSAPLLAIALMFGVVVLFSLYTAYVRREGVGVSSVVTTSITQRAALVFVVPAVAFDLADRGMVRGHVTPKAIAAVLFLGIGTGFAYLLLTSVLASQPSNRVAVTMFATPVLGVLGSWLVVGEHLAWRHGVGGLIVLAAVWLSESGPSRAPRVA